MDAFAELHANLRESLQPVGELQETLFARILECSWNLQRCRLAEHHLYQTTSNIDPLLDDSNAHKYDRIQKYARQYESGLHKNLKALGDLQTEAAFRQQVAPLAEDQPPLSEVCRSVKIRAKAPREQEPESERSVTERYLESLMSRPQLASNWIDPTLAPESR